MVWHEFQLPLKQPCFCYSMRLFSASRAALWLHHLREARLWASRLTADAGAVYSQSPAGLTMILQIRACTWKPLKWISTWCSFKNWAWNDEELPVLAHERLSILQCPPWELPWEPSVVPSPHGYLVLTSVSLNSVPLRIWRVAQSKCLEDSVNKSLFQPVG